MEHRVSPLDAYDSGWRCSCGTVFESDSGFAICPNDPLAKLDQPLIIGSKTIDALIEEHLIDCDQCRESPIRHRMVGLGMRSSHCGTYWHLQLQRANYEGKINNIVAHTELGDEAPIRGRLE